ncbi:MAG: hypothetical protein GX491_00060 [Chloroflexi bacterium]|nr:hypothetical protein [Chloroflexota bacterium]
MIRSLISRLISILAGAARSLSRLTAPRGMLIVLGSALLLTAMAWTSPFVAQVDPTPTAAPAVADTDASADEAGASSVAEQATELPPSATPIPADYLLVENQSRGISIGATVLVLIILIGFFAFDFNRKK